jgi:fumarylacetoacetase
VSGFGPEHLPYGVFRRAGEAERGRGAAGGARAERERDAAGDGDAARVGARLGDRVLDLAALAEDGLLPADPGLFAQPSLNAFMAAGPETWRRVRSALHALVSGPDAELAAIPLEEAELLLPVEVGDYVDFFSSIEHARNAGRMFRPDADPLPPNWLHLPVGYHGRSGTVVVSGTPVRRPRGQRLEPNGPVYGPSTRLDIELELGFVVGVPSDTPVPVERALDHLFGVVLLNDWSARDIQAWESRPLGPFLGKSFATSISAWVTPLDAILDRRVAAEPHDPAPLPYLAEDPWALDLDLEVELNGATVVRTNAQHLYWSAAQQLAHMTVNGATLRVGDLYGSGTISGPEREQRGSFLELSWNGTEPVELPDGTTRTFLEDGDEVVLRGRGGEIELGEVRGRIEPAS